MAYYGQEAVERVRDATDIVDLIGEYLSLKQKGKHYVALCPFHNEKTPSFTVNREKQIYYCFGCQNGGDVFNFLMEYEHLDFSEALEYLAEKAGIELIPESSTGKVQKKDTVLMQINLEVARYFYAAFTQSDGKEAMAYLLNRQIQVETRKKFKLGFAPDSWDDLIEYMLGKNYLPKDLERAGVAIYKDQKKYYARFRNRLMFPIENLKGEIVGFGGRILGNGEPKYLNSPETPLFSKKNNLYAINLALPEMKRTKRALVMEGYMDVIMSHQNGFTNAVASLGTAFTVEQAKLLARYVDEVVLIYDNDVAGRKAILRAHEAFRDFDVLVRVANVEPYKDPDEFIRQQGNEAFEYVIHNALPFYEYILSKGIEGCNLQSIEEKVALIQYLIPFLIEMDNSVQMNEYMKMTAQKCRIDEDSLEFEIKKAMSKKRLKERQETRRIEYKVKAESASAHPSAHNPGVHGERDLLNLCLRDFSIYTDLYEEISKLNFQGTIVQKCFLALSRFKDESDFAIHLVTDQLSDLEKKELLGIMMDEKNPLNVHTAKAWIDVLKRTNIHNELLDLRNKIDFLEKEGKQTDLLEIKKRFQSLQDELKRL